MTKFLTLLLLGAAGSASALTQQCTGEAVDDAGNWYCGAVSQILYEGFVTSGSYQQVTDMTDTGDCEMQAKSYSGALSPLNEDLSIHFRGPLQLKEAAVYYLGSDSQKRDAAAPAGHAHAQAHARRRGHGHGHVHERGDEPVVWVTATIDGKVVSWINDYFGPSTQAAAAAPAPTTTTQAVVQEESVAHTTAQAPATTHKAPAPAATTKASEPAGSDDNSSGGAWSRVAYYNADQQVADNMVFLGNYGGQGSGVWDTTWGNSLAYLNAEGTGGSATSQVLQDMTLDSDQEYAIFSGEKCDGGCGYVRAPDVSYKGFSGSNKVFLFNFLMPLDGNTGFNGDMPALWLLNAQIPRSGQYSSCSCWATGCGEADIFEVLSPGSTKCKSTFHLNDGAGSSDYFDRPVDGYVQVAAVMDGRAGKVSIKVLPSGTDFAAALSDDTVRGWADELPAGEGLSSLFQIS